MKQLWQVLLMAKVIMASDIMARVITAKVIMANETGQAVGLNPQF